MTQGKIGRDKNGNNEFGEVNLEAEKLFFENQIVPRWVPTKVAASILGISPNALRIRKCRSEIECKYFGKELRFDVCYLQSLFLHERKSG